MELGDGRDTGRPRWRDAPVRRLEFALLPGFVGNGVVVVAGQEGYQAEVLAWVIEEADSSAAASYTGAPLEPVSRIVNRGFGLSHAMRVVHAEGTIVVGERYIKDPKAGVVRFVPPERSFPVFYAS